jgi:hypothetical protein
MNAVVPHVFENNLVRSLMRDDEPWFIGSDVAKALGYRDGPTAMRNLDDDEKGTHNVCTPGGDQVMIIVSEPGVFRLIFTSRKPEAERFKRWLAHDVLPQLRRTGSYGQAEPAPALITGEAVPILTTKLAMIREARNLFGHDRARSLWKELALPMPELMPDGSVEEAVRCLEEILGQRPEGSPLCVREMLEEALNDADDVSLALGRHGLRISRTGEDEGFLVANKHPWIASVFKETRWSHGRHMRVLRRLAGSSPAAKQRYGDHEARGTFIPAKYLDEPPQE